MLIFVLSGRFGDLYGKAGDSRIIRESWHRLRFCQTAQFGISLWPLDVTKTGNGEWGMGNAGWGMANEEWGMGNGEWGMGDGEWGMGDGEWGMRNGEWGMGN